MVYSSPTQFLEKYKDYDFTKSEKATDIENKVFEPNDNFNPTQFMDRMKERFSKYGDMDELLGKMWKYYVINEKNNKGQAFKEYFKQFLWPRQMVDAFNWFKRKYGIKKGGD